MESLKQLGQLWFWLASSFGIIVATFTYLFNMRLKQAEWLKMLFEKFYESANYKEVRKWIDYDTIESELKDDKPYIKEEKFADYLNFFEFISVLEKRNQLKITLIKNLFSYYLKTLKQNNFCVSYIKEYGIKNLEKLLSKYEF